MSKLARFARVGGRRNNLDDADGGRNSPHDPARGHRAYLGMALRVVGVAFFVVYLARNGALWPVTAQSALVAASCLCLVAWVTAGSKLPTPAFLAILGCPALAGSIIGAVPGRYELAILFAIIGTAAIIASTRVSLWTGLAVWAACLVAFEFAAVAGNDSVRDWAWMTFGVCTGAIIGYSRRQARVGAEQTRRLIETQQRLLDQAETTRIEREHSAALAERGRIARDLHDVLAHALGGLVVQLDAAEAQLSVSGDADGAAQRLRTARGLAVEGLDDARKAVNALRTDAVALLDVLRRMVDGYDGGPARLHDTRNGDQPSAPTPDAAAAVVAAVREALNNSRKHAAGAPITVWLRATETAVFVDVTNAAGRSGTLAETGSGAGIAGMRERIAAVGGTVKAGAAEGGTWRVSLSVPATLNTRRDAGYAAVRSGPGPARTPGARRHSERTGHDSRYSRRRPGHRP